MNCHWLYKKVLSLYVEKVNGSHQMPHATMIYDSWFLSDVCKDEVDIQRKWGWRQEQAAPATGQGS